MSKHERNLCTGGLHRMKCVLSVPVCLVSMCLLKLCYKPRAWMCSEPQPPQTTRYEVKYWYLSLFCLCSSAYDLYVPGGEQDVLPKQFIQTWKSLLHLKCASVSEWQMQRGKYNLISLCVACRLIHMFCFLIV